MYPSQIGFGVSGLTVTSTGNNIGLTTPAAAVELTNDGAVNVLVVVNAILTSDGVAPLPALGPGVLATSGEIPRILAAAMDTRGYVLKPGKTVVLRGYGMVNAGPQILCIAVKAVSSTATLNGGVTDVSSQ